MSRILFATGNAHKLEEVRAILADTNLKVVSMKEAGVNAEIIENGTSFEENALIKARAVCRASGEMALADDSGLVVDALGGEPGIYSSRWMGEDTSYHVKNARLIELLRDVPKDKRTARFVCACAAVFPDGREFTVQENYEGIIGYEERGENGFGYDPVFFVPDLGKYSAELSPREKNAISHRGKALRAMRDILMRELGTSKEA